MLIKEVWTNATENCIIGESKQYEPFTRDIGELFKSLRREYGRCVSKMFIDDLQGNARQVGWVFQKKVKYTDCNKKYLQETWITVYEKESEKTIQHHYFKF